jgi:hypothetical protein
LIREEPLKLWEVTIMEISRDRGEKRQEIIKFMEEATQRGEGEPNRYKAENFQRDLTEIVQGIKEWTSLPQQNSTNTIEAATASFLKASITDCLNPAPSVGER